MPGSSWGGIVECRIVEVDPHRRLSYTWVVGDIETVLTFSLAPTASDTRLSLVHGGFGPDQRPAFGGARDGWKLMGGYLADLAQLPGLLDRLADSGKSVIVIEHHQSVMAHADWIVDLGPGAGHGGGTIVLEGTPADLVAAKSTLTGQHLADYVGGVARQ